MSKLFRGVIVFALLSAVYCADVSLCSSKECEQGFSCCQDVTLGPQCYDPRSSSCPMGTHGTILCGFQQNGEDFACGLWCYDFVDYVCCGDVIYNRNASNIPWDTCVNPRTSGSAGGSTTGSNQGSNDSESSDNNGGMGSTTGSNQGSNDSESASGSDSNMGSTTGMSGMICGNKMCPTMEFQCCNDVQLGPQCYDPSIYSCPLGSSGTILCGFQEHGEDFACGLTCYDNVTYVCCNNTVYNRNATNVPWNMCINNGENNGNNGNNNGNNGNSGSNNGNNGNNGSASTSDEDGDIPDGGIIIGSTTGVVQLCGNTQCALEDGCCYVSSGTVCFQRSNAYCGQGASGFVVCNIGEQICNMTCYNPNQFFCDGDVTLSSDSSSNAVNIIQLFGALLFVMLLSL